MHGQVALMHIKLSYFEEICTRTNRKIELHCHKVYGRKKIMKCPQSSSMAGNTTVQFILWGITQESVAFRSKAINIKFWTRTYKLSQLYLQASNSSLIRCIPKALSAMLYRYAGYSGFIIHKKIYSITGNNNNHSWFIYPSLR